MKRYLLTIVLGVCCLMLAGCSTYRYTVTDSDTGIVSEFVASSVLYSRTIKSASYESSGKKLTIDGSNGNSQMDQVFDLADKINALRH